MSLDQEAHLHVLIWHYQQEEAAKEDTVRVAGVIRDGEQPNMFVPQNQPEIGQWFYVDVPSMAQTMGLSKAISYMEAVSSPSDGGGRKQFPLPKEFDAFVKSSVMPQDHLNYALTWYGFLLPTLVDTRNHILKPSSI